jgi:hypothetical protein
VSDASAVTILDSFQDLSEQSLCILFIESPVHLGLQVSVQTSSSDVLHHQDHIFGCVDDLIESDDALVLHLLHELDLSFNALPPVWVQQLILLVNLHSYLLI